MTDCTIDIEQYLEKNINGICNNSYHKNTDNHCAHFVSHVLGFRFGFTCRGMTGEVRQMILQTYACIKCLQNALKSVSGTINQSAQLFALPLLPAPQM